VTSLADEPVMSLVGTAGSYRIASPPIVRIAGLRADMLVSLRFDSAMATINAVLAADRWLNTEASAIGQELYEAVGKVSDPALRPVLVGLRRAVHKHARPSRSGLPTAAPVLPAALIHRMRSFEDGLGRRRQLVESVPAILAAEITERMPEFRRALADPVFRHALAHAGPPVAESLERWLDGGRPPAAAKLTRLVMYLSRASTKTSPYSSFTTTGPARWTCLQTGPVRLDNAVEPSGSLEVRGGLIRELERALSEVQSLRRRMHVRVNPSALEYAGNVCFLGPPPGEAIIAVPANPAVTGCLTAVSSPAGQGTLADLRRRLADGDDPPPGLDEYLNRLIDVGLLELHVPVADQAADPLGELARWLLAADPERHAALAAGCLDLRAQLEAPTRLDEVSAHRVRLARVSKALGQLTAEAGLGWTGSSAPGRALAENVVYPQPAADLSLPQWRPVLDDLDVLRHWAALYDPGLQLRLALGAYSGARFGPVPVPFVALYDALQHDLPLTVPPRACAPALADLRRLLGVAGRPSSPGLERVREIDRLRQAAAHVLVGGGAGEDGRIRIAPQVLASEAASWPAYVTLPQSIAAYVQPLDTEQSGLRVVLNVMISGYGRGRSRWLHLVARAGGYPGQCGFPAPLPPPSHPVPAESPGYFGSTLNFRKPATALVIDYPNTVSYGSAERRVALRDLTVAADPKTGGCELRCQGRQIIPVHTGMLAEFLLPPAFQFLVRTFGHPTLLHPGIPLQTGDLARPVPTRPTFLPRIEVGQVTIRRAAWLAPAEQARRVKGETDAAYLLRIHRWLDSHGIAVSCFVQVLPTASGPALTWRDYRKPLFIDFRNWYLVCAFERLLRGTGSLVLFTEALPVPGETAMDATARPPRVCEFIVELTGWPAATHPRPEGEVR
jgi:hypothetical protein